MTTFKLNDTVHWVSRGGATQKLKEGVVERVVPANQRIPAELAKEADAYGLPRDHTSYMVRVGKTATRKGKLYWPEVKCLKAGSPVPRMKLTEKQHTALLEAQANNGEIFHLPEHRRINSATLSALVKAGFLERKPVGVIWSLTAEGKAALAKHQAARKA